VRYLRQGGLFSTIFKTMSEADFYQVLGVQRSASSDEIRSAFRDLVKLYHPDLFSTAAEKEQANEKLRQLNEAYAVLGNPQRRRDYDQSFTQKPEQRVRPGPARRRRTPVRPRPKSASKSTLRKLAIDWGGISKRRLGYGLATAATVMLLFYAAKPQARWTIGWTLVESVETSAITNSPPSVRSPQTWSPVAQFASASECAGALKRQVREDEREGSKAVFDERNGMMAITVQVKKNAQPASPSNSNSVPESAIAADGSAPTQGQELGSMPSSGAVRRIRNIECRAARRLESRSWVQDILRTVGLSS
jgi:curved DNA-binding protein CbpA